MCLGVPGKIVAVGEDIHQLAWVEVSGVKREISIALVCDQSPSDLLGQWVLVHVGFAMSLLDEEEAQQTLEALAHMQAVGLDLDDVASEANDALR
ncbi:TPA: hydrogenase maturation factor HybG [Yersinia enterocolitica]|uniref:[NiFe] hydrogenase metallocenter assembly protein HypC n=3 Tax=Yersinia enterocolitica TaxID=630 RepID=A0A0H3NRD8_YERE1|nr:hydrogenase maturation factor HybG [Yersinia enterocolitica]CBX73439.1 hydrogenase-2 operon protein hybG [Yersinia enterocolitica W22703]ADZ43744.1 hydrogenase 2 accessory protein HypG [Yersinia enterocolitica subsp. palearctica 105.5R(r)]AJJ28442.1 hydrogenase assembly chaperone HypC/HupF [Yersinia enterocolitica]ALG77497.1 hydrogenase 2 accessory protein HypG [Yersinia enterocolitica]EHB22544.1 hydrogenase 2 accessory protein HypG [Yersinia enterocolitica subsp. palearctica PhRBD_Ye1]